MKKYIFILLFGLLFSSCFLTKWQGLNYKDSVYNQKDSIPYNFADYKLYIFKMEEVARNILRNNKEVSFVNGIDASGGRVLEEIYLFKNKNNNEILYFTTEANKYSKIQNESNRGKGYQAFYMLNSLYHKDAFFVQELDLVIKGEIKNDTIVIPNRALLGPNMEDDLKIVFKEYMENGISFLEFISLNSDHRIKKKRKRVDIDTVINMKMKFKESERRLAYMKKGDSIIQYVDMFYTMKNNIYFTKKDKFDVQKNNVKNYRHLLLKERFLY